MFMIGVRSYPPRVDPPPECLKGYSIPCQLIEPACLVLLDLAWDVTGCVPVFIGPPWHAMPFPEVVDYRAAAVVVHMSDISRWASFGAKWVLEKNAPRDITRLHPKWWTPQVKI